MKTCNKIRKNFTRFKDSNDGLAGILVAVLLTGLIVTSIAIIQTSHVPNWMEKKEAEHMNEVAAQFSQLKFAIDVLSASETQSSSMSVPITLGSEEMPFFSSMKSSGSITILPDNCKISVLIDVGGVPTPVVSFDELNLGSIKYSSSNSYYLDQSYIFENGAIILGQNSKNVMQTKPSISLVNKKDFSFELVKITEQGDKTSTNGYTTSAIQVKLLDVDYNTIDDVEQIKIITNYKESWYVFFKSILESPYASDELKDNYIFNPDPPVGNEIIIDFTDPLITDKPDLNLKIVEIGAQLGPGWVET
jgi:hypothetical protein